VFDIENAVITGNYVDIPIYFVSNDLILSVDFEMKFNATKITYDSVINYKSYLAEVAHYNPADKKLRLTSSASNINNFLPIPNNTALFAIRFRFNVPNICNTILSTDISSIRTYLNGDPSSAEITKQTELDFSYGNNNVACVGANAFNTNTNKIINDTISSWFWDFGNGSTSNVYNPVANYTTPATYTVTLIAQSSAGCADTIKKTIVVHTAPLTSFTYAPDCTTGNITFIDLSSISTGFITNWSWDFGDSLNSHQMNPNHNYDYGGTYTVSLTAISDSGCTATSSQSVPVDILSANYQPTKGCIGETIDFKDNSTSTPTSGPITDWIWNFGDASNTITALQNPSFVYSVAGTYHVGLRVSNLNCADSISKIVIIENKPVVKFAEDKISGCMPLTVNFSDSSIVESTSTYLWKFENITDTTSASNISHTYTSNGLYSVKHYVTSSAGCTDSLEKTSYINVYGIVASFTASSVKVKLPDATVRFTNNSNSYNNWTWNFGDSIYSSDKMPEHTFTEAGVHSVCLSGINPNGCQSVFCDSITVENANVVAIPQAFTPNGDNANDVLRVRGGPVKDMELRVFNEWGNQVFISNQQSDGWDGTFNGSPQAVGLYEYTMKGKTIDNESINMHGVVNLIR
jgi:gliding motility-associated-like protein